jgi:membrane-associated protease RseP (regulator of RpoE activity)
MSEAPSETAGTPFLQQSDFEKVTQIVTAEFQVEEALMEHSVPTYYLKQPQGAKQAFLRLLKNLEANNLIAFLRRKDGRIVLKVAPKPPVKPSNIMINWILFFATIATTFVTGYLLSEDLVNPFIGGATFTIAIMTILGLHELGHKITANRQGVEATPPYFIPGPPSVFGLLGFGTFGAVIMQKSYPPNRDSLFDIGASGPVLSFVLSIVATVIGLLFSPVRFSSELLPSVIPFPLLFTLLAEALVAVPQPPPGRPYAYIALHPVAFAGWVGMLVTMLNLLPVATLDGGHVSRSLLGEKARTALSFLSIFLLVVEGFWSMAIFVLFIAMYRHPGPLDDVSSLSTSRKLVAIALIVVFVLCSFLYYYFFLLLQLLGF